MLLLSAILLSFLVYRTVVKCFKTESKIRPANTSHFKNQYVVTESFGFTDDSSKKLMTPMTNYFLKLVNIKFSPRKEIKIQKLFITVA